MEHLLDFGRNFEKAYFALLILLNIILVHCRHSDRFRPSKNREEINGDDLKLINLRENLAKQKQGF